MEWDGYIVQIDHLTDSQLEFFGWIKVDEGDEFSTYWSPRYNEHQLVENKPPRFLIVDDWNDAINMDGGGDVTNAPPKRRKIN